MLHLANNVLTVLAALATVLFVVGYAVRSPWWKNEAGKNTMLFMGVVAGVLVLTLYFRITRTVAPVWLGTVVWGVLNIPLWWRLSILWKAQHYRYKPIPHTCTACGQECAGG